MTKAEEMQRYDRFVASLPQDSYLRPWLSDIRDLVSTDLHNDIIPERTPRETYYACEQIRKDAAAAANTTRQSADADAQRILANANARAKEIIAHAEANADTFRRELRDDIHRLRNALSAVA